MSGQDGSQRKKPHGNPNPKRGNIIKGIFADLTGGDAKKIPATTASPGGGGGGGNGDNSNGGGNGDNSNGGGS